MNKCSEPAQVAVIHVATVDVNAAVAAHLALSSSTALVTTAVPIHLPTSDNLRSIVYSQT